MMKQQLLKTEIHQKQQEAYFDTLDVTSQQIINIIEEYVKPVVQRMAEISCLNHLTQQKKS